MLLTLHHLLETAFVSPTSILPVILFLILCSYLFHFVWENFSKILGKKISQIEQNWENLDHFSIGNDYRIRM